MSQPYDYDSDESARPRALRAAPVDDWGWTGVDGALALDWEEPSPERPATVLRLIDQGTSGSLPRMAWPEAPGLAARSALRERERAKVRRARRLAALVVLAGVALVVLLLTAFGSGGGRTIGEAGPAPAHRLLPSGPPRPQVVALHETLRLQLPVNQGRVTAIGYHASGAETLELEPVGSQANAGLFGRMIQRLVGDDGSGIRFYLLDGGVGPQTGGLDIGAPVGTDVYAPADGTLLAISDYIVDGKTYGQQIEIQPAGIPGVVVVLTNLEIDPALSVGSTVVAARTKLGRIKDLSPAEDAGLARYTQDKGHHVHLETRPAASLSGP